MMPTPSDMPSAYPETGTPPNDLSNDSESDGWDDSDDERMDDAHEQSVVPSDISPTGVVVTSQPNWTMEERQKLPVGLTLENFLKEDSGLTLYRCEAAKKKNPTVSGLQSFGNGTKVHLSICLFNSEETVYMRCPDVKRKKFECQRLDSGIVFDVKDAMNELRFKKKCQNKTGNHTGFELGREYESYTNGTTPQFVFVAVPYTSGYVKNLAIRSPPFKILSKRQERFLDPKTKRRKKAPEIEKLDTDIHNAKSTFNMLEKDIRHETFVNKSMKTFFNELAQFAEHLQNPTAKIAIQFALRQGQEKEPETASM